MELKTKREALKNIMKDAMKKKLDKTKNPYPEIETPSDVKRASMDEDDLTIRIRGIKRG